MATLDKTKQENSTKPKMEATPLKKIQKQDRPSFTFVVSVQDNRFQRELIFTRNCAKRALGGDTDTLAALFGMDSLNDLPRYTVSLLAAVAFGRISTEEMITVTQTLIRTKVTRPLQKVKI